LWNIAEFITLHLNKKGIHPGGHIALDFLIFGALIASFWVDFVLLLPGGGEDFPIGVGADDGIVGAVEGIAGYVCISWILYIQLEL
jgi:hypothetical protein